MNEINVIYQFNEKYVPYAGVSITSLLLNNAKAHEVNVYILGENLSVKSIERLSETAGRLGGKIWFVRTEQLLSEFEEMGMIPYRGAYSVYLRLFFTRLIDMKGKRVVYLDADTIIDRDIYDLAYHDLNGKSIGMVLESITDDYKLMIGMSKESEYYNSGMIVYDVDRWCEKDYCAKLLEHIRNVRSSYIGDQDFINIVCAGDICRLPLKYNFQPLHARYTEKQYFSAFGQEPYYSAEEIEKNREEAAIYHCYRWLGEFPWNRGNLHPFNDIFDRYMQMSDWKGYVKEKADKGPALYIEKMLYVLPRGIFIKIFRKAHEIVLMRAEADARQSRANLQA
ncbi:MAG: glycosyltransferase family 8 protein [Lachnospiraceae bacterium]|nr:glycosyltransferase family 8 protein [Lachnospiraceae bacterium]